MRAVELRSYEGGAESPALVERPVARPCEGQVLVRVAAAPSRRPEAHAVVAPTRFVVG